MRILALTHYYPPEVNAPASRMSEHARLWRDAGHEVTIVTCVPNHPAGTPYPGYRNRAWQDETVDGIRIIRLWTWLAANEGFVPRIANYVSYFLSVLLWMWRLPKADMVISTSPQFFCGLAGLLLQRRDRPWVLEIRDLWPESIVTVGAMKRGAIIRLIEVIERFAYRQADLVVSVTDGFVAHIRKARPTGPIAVIKNGVDLTHFRLPDAAVIDAFKGEHGLTGKFVASYVGTHGMAHGLSTIIDAAERLRHRSDIAFLLVGGGAERDAIAAQRDARGLTNVVMLGQQPKSTMPAIWGASDAALVLLKRVDTFKTVIPSKMFEAMALARPMILGVEGEAKALMEAGNAGIAITPEDSVELAAAVERLADDPVLAASIGASAAGYVRREFDRAGMAHLYLDALQGLRRNGANKGGRMARWQRSFAFARRIPPGQMLARASLAIRRRRSLSAPPQLAAAAPIGEPPRPLFPDRGGMVQQQRDGWRFSFVGRSVAMPHTIDWNAPGPAPEYQLWRMNLHYMEYLEQLDQQTGLALMRAWVDANPPWQPGYWHDSWNSYTLSLRVVVWMQRLAEWGVAADAATAPIRASTVGQLDFLMRNLERDIGGNHLIKNIKALAWGSAFFTGPLAARWRTRALALLAAELPRQILADGMHYERSPSYHAQVFADLIETRHALGDAAPQALDDALARMAVATALLAHADGGPALFNDAGLTMAYPSAQCLAAHAALGGAQPTPPEGPFALPDAGYYGFHSRAFSLIADMGAIGPDTLPAHAHGDIGSFELSVAGERMIVDQGVFEYVAGDRRAASRSAHHHNCLALDGGEPAEFFGAFRCGRMPRVAVTHHVATATGFTLEGEHDGYRLFPGAPIAERRFEAAPARIVLRDRIRSSIWHGATIRLLLHPECVVTLDGMAAIVRRAGATLFITASQPLRLEPAVWWPDMGTEIATQRLCLTLAPGCFESTIELGIGVPGESGAA